MCHHVALVVWLEVLAQCTLFLSKTKVHLSSQNCHYSCKMTFSAPQNEIGLEPLHLGICTDARPFWH
jgi:hypothetical protein